MSNEGSGSFRQWIHRLEAGRKIWDNITTMEKDIKEEILKEVKIEMHENFEELKKEYNTKLEISFSDEEHMMDIDGHSQKLDQ
jgi:hypothetical protein